MAGAPRADQQQLLTHEQVLVMDSTTPTRTEPTYSPPVERKH